MNAKAARHFLQVKAMAWLEAGGEKKCRHLRFLLFFSNLIGYSRRHD
jgi:hypothetical protein